MYKGFYVKKLINTKLLLCINRWIIGKIKAILHFGMGASIMLRKEIIVMKRVGQFTIKLEQPPIITGFGSVVGKKESEGPLKNYFHNIEYDTKMGCDTWEQAESKLQTEAIQTALEKTSQPAYGIPSA